MRKQAKRLGLLLCSAALGIGAFAVPSASAAFGVNSFDVGFYNRDGSPATQAGSHPYAMVTKFKINSTGTFPVLLEGKAKDMFVEQMTGFIGDGTMPRCSTAGFLAANPLKPQDTNSTGCSNSTAVGVADIIVFDGGSSVFKTAPVHNLITPPGAAARIGFKIRGVPAFIDVAPKEDPEYNLRVGSRNISAAVPVLEIGILLWGVPTDPAHDYARGTCAENFDGDNDFSLEAPSATGFCSTTATPQPFITLPRSCNSSTVTSYQAASWEEPNVLVTGSVFNDDHPFGADPSSPANPQPFTGCGKLGFDPTITSAPTTKAAQSPTGLDFTLDIEDPGLKSAKEGAIAESEIKKVVVTLPEGMTANPSLAEGLEVCSDAQLESETAFSPPGAGCPEGSKIGTVEVESPLIDQTVKGALYMAKPFENQFGTLLALYIVIKNDNLGIFVKNRLKVTPDPETGQLTTTVEDIPQLPFSHFRLHFREGARSPLVSPPHCGKYEVKAELTPWAGGPAITTTAGFEIVSGPNETPCPTGGVPFEPGFSAGTLNNNGGSFSPFLMRLIRRDGDQDLTRFDATLPQGMLAKLKGTGKCSDSQIALMKTKTGTDELLNPSCPANSKIGRVMAGAGVGSQLVYVPGSIYLAGPFDGAPLSVIGAVPAVAGPFDVGVVVTQQALVVDPKTGVVKVDGEKSDPIPHILAGIPLTVRDIRVYVDRPEFTINPTSCDPFATIADIWGGGADVFSTHDDAPATRSARFQTANCARLGFKPSLTFKLLGGTKRGGHPALRATFVPRPGDANLQGVVVRLPSSAFLDQSHIRTICTRVQFAADNCPQGAIYGKVKAFTPLLEEPLEGPAYLRSSNNKLPDLVFDLKGLVDIETSARIDSIRGGIRATFEGTPDAPLTKVIVDMQGGKKGLIINSRDLCKGRSRAEVRMDGHNGVRLKTRPVMRPQCGKGRKAKRGKRF